MKTPKLDCPLCHIHMKKDETLCFFRCQLCHSEFHPFLLGQTVEQKAKSDWIRQALKDHTS